MGVTSQNSITKGLTLQGQRGLLSVGADIMEIERVRAMAERWGERFLRRIYTSQELAYCRGRAPHLAARFAAKEAVMKALGTGTRGVSWREIEVCTEPTGAPVVRLHRRAAKRAKALGLRHLAISISHSGEYAVAFVVTTQGEAV